MTIELFLAFLFVHVTASLTPGPAVLLVSAQGMARGWRAGMAATAGILTGNTIYFALSVAGLGVVLASSALAVTLIKYAGAAYLIWLGVQSWRKARQAAHAPPPDPSLAAREAFLQGLVKQLGNPKSVIYFSALLPLFIIPGETQLWHYALMLVSMHVTEAPILAAYAWMGERGGEAARSPQGRIWRERLAGTAQIAVGGLLVTLRRAE